MIFNLGFDKSITMIVHGASYNETISFKLFANDNEISFTMSGAPANKVITEQDIKEHCKKINYNKKC